MVDGILAGLRTVHGKCNLHVAVTMSKGIHPASEFNLNQ